MRHRPFPPSSRARLPLMPFVVGLSIAPSACVPLIVDAGVDDAGVEDAGVEDAGVDDAGVDDAGVNDAGVVDAGVNDAGANDAGVDDAGVNDAGVVRFLNTLASLDDVNAMSAPSGDLKYLAPTTEAGPTPPLLLPCYFQNMAITPFHIEFLRGFPETATMTNQEYIDVVMRRDSRRYWGGAVKFYASVAHPVTGVPPTLIYTVYAEVPASALSVADVVDVDEVLKGCIPFASSFLAFLPSDASQISFANQESDALLDAGVAVLIP